MQAEVAFAVSPTVAGVDDHHPSTLMAIEELVADLQDTPGVDLSIKRDTAEGAKGALETVLITVLPIAIPAVVRLLRLWLARDQDRALKVTIDQEDGTLTKVEASGENVSLDTLQRALTEAIKINRKDGKT